MNRSFELSSRAERSFEAIRIYSTERYGPGQTRRYMTALLDRCQDLADGRISYRPCRNHFAADLRDDLRFTVAGKHFVIFVEKEQGLVIVDFIHQSADVGHRLKGTE